MNPLRRLAMFPVLTLACTSAALTQSTFAQTIANATKTGTNPNRAEIQAFVAAQVKKLTSDKPKDQTDARVALSDAAAVAGGEASAPFLDAYATELNAALLPLADAAKTKDMRTRLNAAIVNERVAVKANNARLQGATTGFLNDPTAAVALWGAKAARGITPNVVNMPGQKFTPQLAEAVVKHPDGPIVREVYAGLSLGLFGRAAAAPPSPAAIKAAIPDMLRVFRERVQMYVVAVPPEPSAENDATLFLTFRQVWAVMTAQQQSEAVQLMSDLINLAGQHAATAEPAQVQELQPLFRGVGQAMQVVGEKQNVAAPAVVTAAKAVQNIGQTMPGTAILTTTTGVFEALQSSGKFPDLKPAPPVASAETTATDDEAADPAVVPEGGEASPASRRPEKELRPVAPPATSGKTPAVPPAR